MSFDSPAMHPEDALALCLADPKWVAERAAFKAWSAALVPILADLASRAAWRLLEFTPEVMAEQCGDPDIAFQCEIDGWVIRADYLSECGPDVFYWRPGSEDECLERFEYFGHGTPTRRATPAEVEEYASWLFRAAFLNYVAEQILPPFEP